MKKISEILSSKSSVLLLAVFTIFLVGSLSDTVVYAGPKQAKHLNKNNHKKKPSLRRVQGKYNELKSDYNFTVANFIVVLDEIVTRIQELEKKSNNLDSKSTLHDDKLRNIRDYLYQKSLDPSYCPFDIFKKWYNDPVHFNDTPSEGRCLVGEDFE